jgi:hypothetical protein
LTQPINPLNRLTIKGGAWWQGFARIKHGEWWQQMAWVNRIDAAEHNAVRRS